MKTGLWPHALPVGAQGTVAVRLRDTAYAWFEDFSEYLMMTSRSVQHAAGLSELMPWPDLATGTPVIKIAPDSWQFGVSVVRLDCTRPFSCHALGLNAPTTGMCELKLSVPQSDGPSARYLDILSQRLTRAGDSPLLARIALLAALLGLGEGLTPSGDDIVSGVLFAGYWLRSARDPGYRAVARAILSQAPRRTHALSVHQLGWAARGEAPDLVAQVWRCWLDADTRLFTKAIAALSQLGHHSGYDWLRGLSIGITFWEEQTDEHSDSCRVRRSRP